MGANHERRFPFLELVRVLADVLMREGFTPERAERCATLFVEASRDGVASHGLNRFPRFVAMVRTGVVDVRGEPAFVEGTGALERWDGRRGPGNLNATYCMDRAIGLARRAGIGCVALRNTNHWMRGGSYGWQAAVAGVIGICWTNTMPNLPPWGAREPRIGNNPLVVAVPRARGPVVLDMAMSQFSYGALAVHRLRGGALPVPGGYDAEGRLSDDPASVEASGRLLPAGFWKGSGLAIVLDLIAAMLAGGSATHEIASDPLRETDLSQVFIAIDPDSLGPGIDREKLADAVLAYVHGAETADGRTVTYPGERTLRTREANMRSGIPVDEGVWEEIRAL